MKETGNAVLLRIFIGESDHYQGKHLYKHIVEWLRRNHYKGVTVLRGVEGYGEASVIHTSDILELSSDLPVVVEIVDSVDKINHLKEVIEEEQWIKSGLITEEPVAIIRYGKLG